MRASMAIKWLHRATTLTLVIIVVVLWQSHSDTFRDQDQFQNGHRINDYLWLYSTKNDSGGATVSVIYRYFLSPPLHGTPQQIMKVLRQESPFLEGDGSISSIKEVGRDKMQIIYSGNVVSLDKSVSYQLNGENRTLHLSWQLD